MAELTLNFSLPSPLAAYVALSRRKMPLLGLGYFEELDSF